MNSIELVQQYLQPDEDSSADFESNVMRLDDNEKYNDFEEFEPSNTYYSYEDQPTEMSQYPVTGVQKVIDLQMTQRVKTTATYPKTSGTDPDRFKIIGIQKNLNDRQYTNKLVQGQKLHLDLTDNNAHVRMLLYQNILLFLSIIFQPRIY